MMMIPQVRVGRKGSREKRGNSNDVDDGDDAGDDHTHRWEQGEMAAERGAAIATTRGRRSRGELFLRTSFRWFSIIEDDLFVPIALPWLIGIRLIWFYGYWNYFKYVFNEMLCACHHCKYCENMANEVMGQKLGVFQVNWPLVPFNCLSGPLLQLQLAVFVSEV